MLTYTDSFFKMVKDVDHMSGKFTFKLPKETIEKLEKLCRLELGKEIDGSDISEPQPPKVSLAERIEQAKGDVNYYKKRLKETRWKLNDLVFFEYRLEETRKELEKLKKGERWLKHSRQNNTVDIEALKQGTDLVEVAQSYNLNLRKHGKEYWARCPFHQEKTPSFSISQEKQVFHCFGCCESGDLLDFVQKMEGCDFKEAIEVLK